MIFPDWEETAPGQAEEALPLYTEWAVDWDTGAFDLRNGKPYTVTGAEALKIWVHLALAPENERFRYSAHSNDYGSGLSALLGETDRGILQSQLRREIRETLTVSPYITSVDGFAFTFSGSSVTVTFTAHTIYEELQQSWEGEL